ncbi:MAG TPA: F0F1 ATP synthase subunit B [Microthrixaceae bacterium]|nr:F0F1 ATP synthase subunit B [Microthrixaceae bacterium]
MLSTIAALAQEAHAEETAHHPNGYWLPGDKLEVLWGTLAFLIVMGLLYWKAGPPIRNAMKGRTERIAGELDAAKAEREEAEAERDRIKAALADSDAEAARIVEEARRSADRLRTDLEVQAVADGEALRVRAAADLEATRRLAVSDLTAEVSRLALGAAEKVVAGNLDDEAQQHLIEQYISQVGSSN